MARLLYGEEFIHCTPVALDVRLRARFSDPSRRDGGRRVVLRGLLARRRLHRLPLLLALRRRPHAPHEPAAHPQRRNGARRQVRVRAAAAGTLFSDVGRLNSYQEELLLLEWVNQTMPMQ